MEKVEEIMQKARQDPTAKAMLEQAEKMGYDVKKELQTYLENSNDPRLKAYSNQKNRTPSENTYNSQTQKQIDEIYSHIVQPKLAEAERQKYMTSLTKYISENPKEALEKIDSEAVSKIAEYLAGKDELEEVENALQSKIARDFLRNKYNENPSTKWITETTGKISYADIEEEIAEYAKDIKQLALSQLEQLDEKQKLKYVLSELLRPKNQQTLYEEIANQLANKGYKPKSLEEKITPEENEKTKEGDKKPEDSRNESGLEDAINNKKDAEKNEKKKERKDLYNIIRNAAGLPDEKLPTDEEIANYKKELKDLEKENNKFLKELEKEEGQKNQPQYNEQSENTNDEQSEKTTEENNFEKAKKESI